MQPMSFDKMRRGALASQPVSKGMLQFSQIPDSAHVEIKALYRDLSVCLDNIQNLVGHIEDSSRLVCLAVLEDDLSDLLEECSERLLMTESTSDEQYLSLESRSYTVIEELMAVLSQRPNRLP